MVLCMISMLGASSFFINPYIFHQDTYQCPKIVSSNCNNYVCGLPVEERTQYLVKKYDIVTMATAFGDLHCEKIGYLTIMQTAMISGAFVGIIIGIFLTDLFGRKMTIVYSLAVAILGLLIMMA